MNEKHSDNKSIEYENNYSQHLEEVKLIVKNAEKNISTHIEDLILTLDPEKLFEILSTSTGSCWAINNYCPVKGVGPKSPADNKFKPGFSGDLSSRVDRLFGFKFYGRLALVA